MTIFCGFTFFRDFDIVKLKLEEMYEVVDYFVISESTKTHSGKAKPPYFSENKHLFSKYSPKIIYQLVTDTPDDFNNLKYKNDPSYDRCVDIINKYLPYLKGMPGYARDFFEKDMLYKAVQNCYDDDIFILGDSDEIAKATTIDKIIGEFDHNQVYQLEHRMYNYYLNMRKNEYWIGNLIMDFKKFKETSFSWFRETKKGIKIPDAGWHYTYTGGKDAIATKLDAFCEQSFNNDVIRNNLEYNIENALGINKDLFNRQYNYWLEEINYENSPKYLVENQNYFSEYIYRK